MSKSKRVLWSIDILEEGDRIHSNAVEALRSFIGSREVEVEPVFVLNPERYHTILGEPIPFAEQCKPAIENALRDISQSAQIKTILPPRVLTKQTFSTSDSVEVLAQYALQCGADLIVLGTHARSGMPRFFIGSFTETFLLHSKIPVLVVNPKTVIKKKFEHILFPTDLGKWSRHLFREVVQLASELQSVLHVLHVVHNPIDSVIRSEALLGGGDWSEGLNHIQEEVKKRRHMAQHWETFCQRQNVAMRIQVLQSKQSVVSTINEYTEKNSIGLIAIAAQSDAVSVVFAGSITRQLVRESSCPVWVLRAKK